MNERFVSVLNDELLADECDERGLRLTFGKATGGAGNERRLLNSCLQLELECLLPIGESNP